MNEWYERFRHMPFVDAHCHVMPAGVGAYAYGNRPFAGNSALAGLLLGYGSRLCFLAAGMEQSDIDGIWSGELSAERCRQAVLRYLPLVEAALPVAFCRRGLAMLLGEPIGEITEANWDTLERALVTAGSGRDYDHLLAVMERDNIDRLLLNMWTGWGASYYGRYMDALDATARGKDGRAYATLATFDSNAIAPFTEPTREYARLVGGDAESFDGYDRLIEQLADFFVHERGARGFKISECYFRALDYRPVPKEDARRAFCANPSDAQKKTLSDYVTWRVLEQAQRLRTPVQIHTGELWGDTAIAQVNPMHLETAVKAFPDVRFDILHGGYPFMAELGIMAQNLRNVYLNLSYMPLRSLEQFEHWLDVYVNIASGDRILVGTDVFDAECMAGCIDFIRRSCASVASRMQSRGVASAGAIERLFERILHRNAKELYRL